MDYSLPKNNEKLGTQRVEFLQTFAKSCRRTILEMLKTSQSGHPGGSLSCLDYLSTLYAFRISKTNEDCIVSNGHISPGVYSVLAEMGVVDKDEVIKTFRQKGSKFEGHVTRHIPGIPFGTGPLGSGISAAAGFAYAEKLKGSDKKVFACIGDGEVQEGQVHEMALFANKKKLNNFTVFCDYNAVQLTHSLDKTMPTNIKAFFLAHDWEVLDIDGHDHEALWKAINHEGDQPVLILGNTIMGNGVPMMQKDGENHIPTWHGQAPKPDQIDEQLALPELTVNSEQLTVLNDFRKERGFNPTPSKFTKNLTKDQNINTGTPVLYEVGTKSACRGAYGKALLDLAKNNLNIIAGTADVGGSVMTKFVAAELPTQHIEFGICEQNMVSVAGGLSVNGFVPFVSTFGAFMSSRAKDQARLNDVNQINVKMVSTHCGLSVGEDGPTHQAIDDMGSFMGMFNTHVIEPADANHCDRIIRYVASHYGNFYVRMGRHALPVLTKPDGTALYDENYEYTYGETTVLQEGNAVTLVASGPMIAEAMDAVKATGIDAEIVIVSSPKKFDDNLKKSLQKTKKIIVVEDHNGLSGFASQVAMFAAENGIVLEKFIDISPKEYQLSGTPAELYASAGVGSDAIGEVLKNI